MTHRSVVLLCVMGVACGSPVDPDGAGSKSVGSVEDTAEDAAGSATDLDSDDASADSGQDTATADDSGTPEDSGDSVDSGTEPEAPAYFGQVLDPPWAPPSFSVQDQAGEARTSASFIGQPTVLWFFRDTASACTNDACGYRDRQVEFDALGVQIVAVGPTTVSDNAAWAASLDYGYQIWADTEGVVAAGYGVESHFDEGNLRHAFLLDENGHAILRYEGAVSVGADPEQVLSDCRVLYAAADDPPE